MIYEGFDLEKCLKREEFRVNLKQNFFWGVIVNVIFTRIPIFCVE